MLTARKIQQVVITIVSAGIISTSWAAICFAQEVYPPKSVTAPASAPIPQTRPAPTAAANPVTGVPGSAPMPVETQSASGTYETLDPAAFANLEKALKSMEALRKNTVKPEDIGTLVFTLWQHSLLQDAKRLFTTRRPTDSEMSAASNGTEEPKPPTLRELSLSGILYKGKDNWIIWLNGQRVAPNAIPKEVIDIKVSKNHVDLKWFDSSTNLIYPIRIRPHQRFNLDTRIFLPGITADAAAQLQAASTDN